MSDGSPIREDGRRRDPDRFVRGFSTRAIAAAARVPAAEDRASVPALGGT